MFVFFFPAPNMHVQKNLLFWGLEKTMLHSYMAVCVRISTCSLQPTVSVGDTVLN